MGLAAYSRSGPTREEYTVGTLPQELVLSALTSNLYSGVFSPLPSLNIALCKHIEASVIVCFNYIWNQATKFALKEDTKSITIFLLLFFLNNE